MRGVGVELTGTGMKMYEVYEGLVWCWASEAKSFARASVRSLPIAESLNALRWSREVIGYYQR
jgi:hypothetical protein